MEYAAACITYVIFRAMSGAGNGLIYARVARRPERRWPFTTSWFGVHLVEVLVVWPVVLALFLLGMDAVHLLAGAMVASPLFKGFINLGSGLPFITPKGRDADGSGRPGWELLGLPIPVLATGYWRLLEAAVGVGLFWYQDLVAHIWPAYPGATAEVLLVPATAQVALAVVAGVVSVAIAGRVFGGRMDPRLAGGLLVALSALAAAGYGGGLVPWLVPVLPFAACVVIVAAGVVVALRR